MRKNDGQKLAFSRSSRRKVEANFEGGAVSSEDGILLLREADRKTGFIEKVSGRLENARQSGKASHQVAALMRQRVLRWRQAGRISAMLRYCETIRCI
jgi:hypothetical protein